MLARDNAAVRVDDISLALFGVVLCVVAVLAEQLQVVVIQGDAWDGDVVRREVDFVVNNLTGADQTASEAALT